MSGAEFPPCWLFGLRWPSTGAYRPFGGAKGRLQEGLHQGVLSRTSAASVLVPAVSHSRPPASSGDPLTLARRSGSVSLLLPPGFWCAHYFVCDLQEWSLCFPQKQSQSPAFKALNSNPAILQRLILWEFLLPLLDLQVGKPDIGLRTVTPVGGLPWYNCSPVCESPT